MKNILTSTLIFTILCFFYFQHEHRFEVTVEFFDVGQGDSALITLGQDFQILIDGGPSEDVLDHLQKSMPFYDKQVEMIILSHADADHLAGLLDVIQDYEVEQIFMTRWEHDSQLYRSWLKLVEHEGAMVHYVEQPELVALGKASLEFFHPSKQSSENRDVNNESIVFKFHLGDISILFPGDIEQVVEDRLVFVYGDALSSTMLKVPHHGSKTSSSINFLAAVDPSLAVIQVGEDNAFGHPHQRVIDRYHRNGIRLFRTDLQQSITFRLSSQEIWVDRGMEDIVDWIIGKNWQRVYNLDT